MAATPAFSSLLIGNNSSTSLLATCSPKTIGFQFPPHREQLFNFARSAPRGLFVSFSSLLIGNNSSTSIAIRHFSSDKTPFSSLLIGNNSSTDAGALRSTDEPALSVPSSSGTTLQLRQHR